MRSAGNNGRKTALGWFTMILSTLFPAGGLSASQGEKTIQNLNSAIQGETEASHRYSLFAAKAESEGYLEVAELFRAISKSEAIHLANHKAAVRQLGGKTEKVELEPVKLGNTAQNLKFPIEGEKKEESEIYPEFIQQARKDGAKVAVQTFVYARDAEAQHETLLKSALKNLGQNADLDYYVNTKTGATIAKPAGSPPPASTGASDIAHSPGSYIQIG